ncbi:hypothetical protein AWN76_011310 [Rhodothermaceae bacterium RA]|nr:hypothetical protein AWN76_011310 [Rhodothermaceae bacterium RA]
MFALNIYKLTNIVLLSMVVDISDEAPAERKLKFRSNEQRPNNAKIWIWIFFEVDLYYSVIDGLEKAMFIYVSGAPWNRF